MIMRLWRYHDLHRSGLSLGVLLVGESQRGHIRCSSSPSNSAPIRAGKGVEVHRPSLAIAVVVLTCGGLLAAAGGLLGAVAREDLRQQDPLPATVSIPALTSRQASDSAAPDLAPVADDGSVSPILFGPDDDQYN
jgi:hypothetical protein